jgi:Domain of unknown function (DUF4110)
VYLRRCACCAPVCNDTVKIITFSIILQQDDEDSEVSSQASEYDSEDDYAVRQDDDSDGDTANNTNNTHSSSAGMSCLTLEDRGESQLSDNVAATSEAELAAAKAADKLLRKEARRKRGEGLRAELRELQERLGTDEPSRTPLAGESLRQFYARTAQHWAEQHLAAAELR